MPPVPEDAAVAFERAEMMEVAAAASVDESHVRYSAHPTEANRQILRADLEALRDAHLARKAADDLVFTYQLPYFDDAQVAFINKHHVDRTADAARAQQMIDLLDQAGELRASIADDDQPPS